MIELIAYMRKANIFVAQEMPMSYFVSVFCKQTHVSFYFDHGVVRPIARYFDKGNTTLKPSHVVTNYCME